jgi:hypothetical protein
MEDVFIQIGKGQQDDPIYVMNTAEKDCLDSFMAARNNALVWGKSNVDKSGKAWSNLIQAAIVATLLYNQSNCWNTLRALFATT